MATQTKIEFSPVATRKASEAIYEQISEMIMSGQIAPGDRLPSERAMMEMFQRSRPTIREALRMLEHSGLIKTIPGSNGAVVTKPSSTSVEQSLENMISMNKVTHQDILEVRDLLEQSAVVWAAQRRTEEDLKKMKDILMESEKNMTDFDEFSRYDLAFHKSIAEAGHNKLASIIGRVCHRLILDILKTSYERKNDAERVQMIHIIAESHNRIYEAIMDKDEQKANQAMTDHIGYFSKDVV